MVHLFEKFCSKLKKNELSLVLTIGCPGAVWGKGNIQQSHLTSPPPHKFWKPFGSQTKVIWVRGALVKQIKDLSLIFSIHDHGWSSLSLNIYSMNCCCCYFSVTQSFLTLHDPMEHSPPGSSVHGIFQAGILEWAIKLMVINTFNEKIAFMRGHMQK